MIAREGVELPRRQWLFEGYIPRIIGYPSRLSRVAKLKKEAATIGHGFSFLQRCRQVPFHAERGSAQGIMRLRLKLDRAEMIEVLEFIRSVKPYS